MTAILPAGIPVGSKLFSAALTGEAVDRCRALPDLITVFIPPLPPALFIAEMSFPASVWLLQERAAVSAKVSGLPHHLHVRLNRSGETVDVLFLTVVSDLVTAQVEVLGDLPISGPLCTELSDLFFLKLCKHGVLLSAEIGFSGITIARKRGNGENAHNYPVSGASPACRMPVK
jgi:hypothetical protein